MDVFRLTLGFDLFSFLQEQIIIIIIIIIIMTSGSYVQIKIRPSLFICPAFSSSCFIKASIHSFQAAELIRSVFSCCVCDVLILVLVRFLSLLTSSVLLLPTKALWNYISLSDVRSSIEYFSLIIYYLQKPPYLVTHYMNESAKMPIVL
jgi:hypothetical protein